MGGDFDFDFGDDELNALGFLHDFSHDFFVLNFPVPLELNSQPFSKQYNYDKEEWDKHILQLHKTFKILTTSKVTNLLTITLHVCVPGPTYIVSPVEGANDNAEAIVVNPAITNCSLLLK